MQFLNTIIANLVSWVTDAREEGQTLVEYALIIALVSIALVASLGLLATGIGDVFTDIITAFG